MQPTDPTQLIADLDGGMFANKLGAALSAVAAAVIDHGKGKKKGKITVTLDFSQIGDSHQVQLDHTLTFSHPTPHGKQSEEDQTSTPLYVSKKGLMLFPDTQADMFRNKQEA